MTKMRFRHLVALMEDEKWNDEYLYSGVLIPLKSVLPQEGRFWDIWKLSFSVSTGSRWWNWIRWQGNHVLAKRHRNCTRSIPSTWFLIQIHRITCAVREFRSPTVQHHLRLQDMCYIAKGFDEYRRYFIREEVSGRALPFKHVDRLPTHNGLISVFPCSDASRS